MTKKNDGIYWKEEVKNFGWRKLSGHKYFKAQEGTEFLRHVLPDTDNYFNRHNYRRDLAIQNHHHDSHLGDEWYYIVPCSYCTYDRNH